MARIKTTALNLAEICLETSYTSLKMLNRTNATQPRWLFAFLINDWISSCPKTIYYVEEMTESRLLEHIHWAGKNTMCSFNEIQSLHNKKVATWPLQVYASPVLGLQTIK